MSSRPFGENMPQPCNRVASVAALLLYRSRVSGSDGDGGITSTLRKLLCGVEMGHPSEQLDGVKFRDATFGERVGEILV